MRENQFSTWFSHDEYVGVKCMRTLYSPITSAALVSKSGSLDTMCRSSLCHLPRQLQSELTPVSPPPPCPCAGSPTATPPRPPAPPRPNPPPPPDPPFARRIVRRRLGNGRERGGCDDGLHRSHRQRDRGVVGCDGLVCGVA